MRALMTAGPALARDNVAGYNCAFVSVNRLRAFDEILYVLMCGTGVGFKGEDEEVKQIQPVAETFHDTDTTIVVADSKIGWAKAYKELVALLIQGQIPQWDTSKVRPEGARLKTFGGRASRDQDHWKSCLSSPWLRSVERLVVGSHLLSATTLYVRSQKLWS